MTAFDPTPLDVRVALSIDGAWEDISDDVLYEKGIKIKRGSGYDTPRLEAMDATLTLKDLDAKYMRLNPMSPLYDKLFMNQPARIDRYILHTEFTIDSASGWSATDEGYVWSTSGAGGTVSATDWSVSSGAAHHSIPVANAYRLSYLANEIYENAEVVATCRFPTGNITGGPVGAGIMMRGDSLTSYLQGMLFIDTDDIIQYVVAFDDNDIPPIHFSTGITNTGQAISIVLGCHEDSTFIKVWEADDPEPVDWAEIGGNAASFGPGFIGLKSIRYTGNTNTSPFVVDWLNCYVRSPRAVGVVPEWPPRWDRTGIFKTAPIQIS